MTHDLTLTQEGGGWVATCTCTWIAFHIHRTTAEDMRRKHRPRDKKED